MNRPGGLSLWCFGLGLVLAAARAAGASAPERGGDGLVKVEMHVLTEMNIAAVAIDVEPFSAWCRPVIEATERRFKGEKERRDVVVQVTLHKKGAPEIAVAGRPALSAEDAKALVEAVHASEAPHAKAADFSFRLVAKVNGGHPAKDLALSPPLETPDERRLARFEKAGTAERLALLRQWAREEALPVLAAFAARADAKFAGVRGVGKMLGGLDASRPLDVETLTERNPDYWRAVVEMTPGEPLVPAVKVALHAANGEMDKARRLAEVLSFFDSGKSGPSRLLADFRRLAGVFYKDVNARVGEGIRLHDKGQYDKALAVYDAVLREYPKSAWAHYERFHTLRTIALSKGRTLGEAQAGWPEAAKAIYACDPLYPITAEAKSGAEAYLMIRRMEINELFKDRSKTRKDILKYADIALDLGEYGFSSLIYWDALPVVDAKDRGDRNLVEYFLYGLERLGVTQLKENFKGDHKAEFARIAAECRKRMEESPAYKAVRGEKPAEKTKPAAGSKP
jgi:hypothetical protein